MMMVVIDTYGQRTMWICPCSVHMEDPMNSPKAEPIPIFYTEHHAMKEGWVFTDHIKFCPPDKDVVAVCPECASKYDWKEFVK